MTDTYRPGYIYGQDIEIPQGGDFFLPLGIIAETDEGVEYLLDTTGYTAFMTVLAEGYDGDIVLSATSANSRIAVGYTPVKWATATVYVAGQQVVPKTALNGYIYECTVGGTSHAVTEPTWPTTITSTVVDNTVTWRCELAETVDNGLVSNCYVQVLAAVTEALTDWGRGVYTLQVLDTFGHLVFWMDGVARLRRETVY